MKKLLLLSSLLLAACDDNSNKQSSNPNTNQSNTNTSSGLLSALTQKDVEFFKNNPQEREATLKKCYEDYVNKKFTIENNPPECIAAVRARKEVDIETELKGDISVEAFRENAYKSNPLVLSGAALDAAVYCSPGDTSIPLNHPICKAIIEFARQLKAECKKRVCDSDELFKRLQIKE